MDNIKPTLDMYKFVQDAFDYFNEHLFDGSLKECLITLQREKNVMGYFSPNRWQGQEGMVHELALNPAFFATHGPLEFFQTLVHEMCHMYQQDFGVPSARTYHNKEWADKMESMGLMPSSTGRPGGKRTGQSMSDYPIEGGKFYQACLNFAQLGFQLPYLDRRVQIKSTQIRLSYEEDTKLPSGSNIIESKPVKQVEVKGNESRVVESLSTPLSEQFHIDQEELLQVSAENAASKKKTTFQCPSCQEKAWGKASLQLICAKCETKFEPK